MSNVNFEGNIGYEEYEWKRISYKISVTVVFLLFPTKLRWLGHSFNSEVKVI